MNNSVKLLTILLAMIVTSGQAWAQDPSNKPPYFIDKDNIKLAVPEEKTKAKAGCVEAGDEENDGYTFEITGGTAQDLFDIGLTTGVVTMKNGVEPFDYEAWKESGTKYAIVVDLCDTRATTFNTNLCSQAKFEVSVTDVNEKPYFTNQSDVINMAEGATISTDAITYADPDKYTDEYLNNELVITGGASDLFELTSDGYVKPKDGAVIEKSEYEIVVRVRDANKDGENYIYPDLYNDKTFKIRYYVTGVDYLDWDDTQKKLVKKNTATDDNDANDKVYILTGGADATLGAGWYVAEGIVTYTGWLRFNGDAHIILADGCKMTVTYTASAISGAIYSNRASITIYAQSTDEKTMGSLTAISEKVAAIFAEMDHYNGYVTINGGIITAKGTDGIHSQHTGNTANGGITINGGKVIASGSNTNNGSGIRADNNSSSGSNPSLIINGGEVIASNSADHLASISADYITITGGKVEANNTRGPGISAYNTITITGGQVEAIGRDNGIYADKGDISITGGQVEASGTNGDGICASNGNINLGWTNADDYIMASSYKNEYSGSVKLPAGKAIKAFIPAATEGDTDKPFAYIAGGHTLTDAELTALAGKTLKANPDGLAYLDWSDTEKKLVKKNTADDTDPASANPTNPDPLTANDFVYVLQGGAETTLGGGWYVAEGDVTYTGRLKFTGDAHIILADRCEMTVGTEANPITDEAIYGNNASVAIYGQGGEKEGKLTAAGYNAIYAHNYDDYTSITINGGQVTANGSSYGIYARGEIGSASVTINGGQVEAKGDTYGIYASSSSGSANVSINGGLVTGTGDSCGIRATSNNEETSVTINGGQVEAIGDDYGIIALSNGGSASVTINGGQVTATSTATGDTYGIYASSSSGSSSITINGGQVTATGSYCGIYARSSNKTASITLGWTNADDFIKASSYKTQTGSSSTVTVKIPAGKALAYTVGDVTTVLGSADDADYVVGSGTNATLDDIAGKELHPVDYITTGDVTYFAMCRLDGDWKLMDGVKAYVITGYDTTTSTVTLSEAPLGGLPEGVPVILMKDTDGDGSPDGNLSEIDMVGTYGDEAAGIKNSVIGKGISPLFTAGDGTKTMADLLYDATGSNDTSDYLVFVLEKGVFKPVAFSDSSVPATGTCILFVSKLDVLMMVRNGVTPPASGARQRGIPFDLGSDATGIESVANVQSSMFNGQWFDLQGRRLDQAPKAKGVYIRNGIQVVVK